MNSSSSKEVILFHGSKADFDLFNSEYIGTGENAGPGAGFHFTDSFKGAASHARGYVKSDGEPLVYVCRLKEGANVIKRGIAPSKHSQEIQKIWHHKLPVACSALFDCSDWFHNLEQYYSQVLVNECAVNKLDAQKIYLLKQAGIDLITNYEEGYQDAYLDGDVILVLNTERIDIIEKLPVNDMLSEILGKPHKYVLSNTKAMLGDSSVLSYLRRII